jgi:hypothetical protein
MGTRILEEKKKKKKKILKPCSFTVLLGGWLSFSGPWLCWWHQWVLSRWSAFPVVVGDV